MRLKKCPDIVWQKGMIQSTQMLEVVITTSQNSCLTDFENESEKKQIAVNAFKTRVKSPGPNPAFKNSANQITLSSAVFNSR